jgi:hypothetical protein
MILTKYALANDARRIFIVDRAFIGCNAMRAAYHYIEFKRLP